MMRLIAHIDMDAFFAAVEMLDDPGLRGRPVIVGGDSRRGVVSAAGYEARAFGVHSAMPIFQAKRLCPDGVFLPVRMERYREVSRDLMRCLGEFSPLVEQVSVDEAFMDCTGTGKLFGDPERLAVRIKKRIVELTSLTCSVGMAPCKFLAKIASDMDKPDGLTVISPGEVRRFIDGLPIGKVPGIGTRTMECLKKIGITHLGDVRNYPGKLIREMFGKFGERLIRNADGIDDSPVVPYTEPKSVSSERTLPEDTDDNGVLEKHILRQSGIIARRLRKHSLRGRTVTLKLKFSDFRQITRSVTLDKPTFLGGTIYRETVKLLAAERLTKSVRLVGVGVSNLEPAGGTAQQDLFGTGSPSEEKWERAERAVDEIVKRYGDGSVKRGRLLD